MDVINTPIQYIKGVGPSGAERFKKLDIQTVRDLLYTFPRAYDDRRNLPKIRELQVNQIQGIVARIDSIEEVQTTRQPLLKCRLTDATGSVEAIWFNQSFLKKRLKPGMWLYVKGKVALALYQAVQLWVQEHEFLQNPATAAGKILPTYPLVAGLYQSKFREVAEQAIRQYLPKLRDPIPAALRTVAGIISLPDAIAELHFPTGDRHRYLAARHRIVFDEFFYIQLALAMREGGVKKKEAIRLNPNGDLLQAYLQNLPYTLTGAQQKAIREIGEDIQTGHPMNRLIQGDVGSGKTDIAACALLMALDTGLNGAILAPTELLAEQHYARFKTLLNPLGVQIELLKGKLGKKTKAERLAALKEGEKMIAVGTHALITERVEMNQLGMVIIDEQHRFGVMQRHALQAKGQNPHSLYLTATPIPRSLMLTVYGDLDKTNMDELPPGRKPAITRAIHETQIGAVYDFCLEQLRKGFQLYIVYPLIEESEKTDLKSAIAGYEELQFGVLNTVSADLLHGKMKPKEKQEVMDRFRAGTLQVLVSTTVIEVGVNVPNATCMIIMNAERFGLSQLHQLRGRIGRGSDQSYCFLISKSRGENAKQRLGAMVATTDGFKIAEYDLKLRGPGDMLGTRQAGLPDFNVADLIRDEKWLLEARKAARHLLQLDPSLSDPKHQAIREELTRLEILWAERLN